MMAHRTILFREEHSPYVLVPRVDHICAPGVFRRGRAQALITWRCVFRFDPARARFNLASTHLGETAETIHAVTGFDYDQPATVPLTPDPTLAQLALLLGPLYEEMLETYPEFCRRLFGRERQETAA